MNKQSTILCMTSTQVVFIQCWNYLLCLIKHTICTSIAFEWLNNFHLVLSDADFSFARSSMSCLWVISHIMNLCPNLISLFHRILFYVVEDVCFYSTVSRWVLSYVVGSPLWHVVIGSLVDYSFVFRIFYFVWKILGTVCVLRWDYSHLTVVVINVKCSVWHSFQRHQFL